MCWTMEGVCPSSLTTPACALNLRRDPKYDGLFEVPTLAEYLAVAKVGSCSRAAPGTGRAKTSQCA